MELAQVTRKALARNDRLSPPKEREQPVQLVHQIVDLAVCGADETGVSDGG